MTMMAMKGKEALDFATEKLEKETVRNSVGFLVRKGCLCFSTDRIW